MTTDQQHAETLYWQSTFEQFGCIHHQTKESKP